MRFAFLLAWLAVLLTGGLALLSAWRWAAIRTRPRVTCDEAAGSVGKAVLLVGRTAAGPVLSVPGGRETYVACHTVEVQVRTVSDNYSYGNETTETTEATETTETEGDDGLYGAGGTRVVLAAAVGRRPLFLGCVPMMRRTLSNRWWRDELRVTRTTFAVSADVSVIARAAAERRVPGCGRRPRSSRLVS